MIINTFQLCGSIMLVLMFLSKNRLDLSDELRSPISVGTATKKQAFIKLLEYHLTVVGLMLIVSSYILGIFGGRFLTAIEGEYFSTYLTKIIGVFLSFILSNLLVFTISAIRFKSFYKWVNSDESFRKNQGYI